jgi:large subunit ribosomal protein L23
MRNFGILKEILLTEKSNLMLSENGQYVFVVDASANKTQIARAVEEAFSVKVVGVNVMNYHGKPKRIRSRDRTRYTIVERKKKAIVVLKDGDRIDVA